MNALEREWKPFLFPEIFEIKGGFYNKKPISEENGNIPFIGATDSNNGITQFNTEKSIDETTKTGDDNNVSIDKKIFKGNCIVVTNNGSVGYAYYQKHPFACSHDVNPLYLKHRKLTPSIAKFLICVIEKQRVCFSYVHKWRPKRMRKSKILLPVTAAGLPDYDYMEAFVKEREKAKRKAYLEYINNIVTEAEATIKTEAKDIEWRDFFVKDVFKIIQRGKRLTREHQVVGKTPYVSSSALNNGVDNFIGNDFGVRKFKNGLSLANSGSVGTCFYEPFEFIASDHVTHLKCESFNKFIYLFLAVSIEKQRSNFNFNREINDSRIKQMRIMLPVNDKKSPDFDYMELYAKNIMMKKYRNYLVFLESHDMCAN